MNDFNSHSDTWEGFGGSPMSTIQELNKALEANEGVTDIANLDGLSALQPQSLESTLAMLTFKQTHLTMWKDIPKSNAYSTLEEYSVQDGYGSEGGFVEQMETPLEGDPTAQREFAVIKFLRTLWKVSDVSGIVTTIKDSEVWAKEAATLRLLRSTNSSLYTGDAALIPAQFNGFQKTIEGNGSTDHVVDLRGAAPTQTTFRLAAELISANFGNIHGAKVYCSPGGLTTLDQIIENVGTSTAQRYIQGNVQADGGLSIGHTITAIKTSFGTMMPTLDIFLAAEFEGRGVPKIKNASGTLVEGATSMRSPAMPTIAVAAATTVTGSLWASTGVRPSGVSYNYRVVARNRFGMSAASVAAVASGAVAAAGSNDVTITPGSSTYPETCYEIYSEKVAGSGDYKFVKRVAKAAAATTVFVDLNTDIPGTTRMFILDMTSSGADRAVSLARLSPLHSKQYARIGEYKWGSVNLYVTPKFYAPLKFVMIKNVPVDQDSSSTLLPL